jgi:tRNA pseudouridine13 synthase
MTEHNIFSLPDWPPVCGAPRASAVLRAEPGDFLVDELSAVEPGGAGGHLWLWVRKVGANTDWVAGQLARVAGCPVRDVGYAGMKDRHAVTRQWFSVPVPPGKDLAWPLWDIADVTIESARLHDRKLKRGALAGNRFRIVLRELAGDRDDLVCRLEQVGQRGVANYFGPQRFGFGGQNVQRGVRWLHFGGRLPRSKRSIYLSAVRSFLFNEVLAERVRQGQWDQLLDGDIAMLDGTHSIFCCTLPDHELQSRCAVFDLHPTGPLPGVDGLLPERAAALVEQGVLQPFMELVEALRAARVDSDRRSLRLCVRALQWSFDDDSLSLEFELPPGAYATTVISELVSTAP